ncbi:MAG: leucyl aminopeptidase [Gammaproteobacteria bacterium PRO9]|nr:leucyl aminopeptidase [Gammaproteobacteria bacterium PRO9]
MQIQISNIAIDRQQADCAIVAVYGGGKLSAAAKALDAAAGGLISRAIGNHDIKDEAGELLLLTETGKLPARRILLVGLGNRDKLDRRTWTKALRNALSAVARSQYRNVVLHLTAETVRDADAYRRARLAVEAWQSVSYRFTAMKSEPGEPAARLEKLSLAGSGRDDAAMRRGIAHGGAIGRAVALAKDLGNLPPNVCTPTYLADRARAIAKGNKKLQMESLSLATIRKLGMGAFLAVTSGSAEPPRFIVLQYKGGRAGDQPVVFVGKGITFDAGGISIKPAGAMDEMKYDMCGAATVLGLMQAVAELKLPMNVVGIVPTCENLPSGTATRPGDIVRTMSGQTVEILNTDAEGRLILCDALNYALRFKPAALIDMATLTGACLVALGRVRSGLLGNSDKLANRLLAAGEAADDRAWRLPLDDDYAELLKSPFADVANIGGRDAGTITAAKFLSRFVGKTEWAHLDIAGTAWNVGSKKGGTGRPIPLLMEFLLNRQP